MLSAQLRPMARILFSLLFLCVVLAQAAGRESGPTAPLPKDELTSRLALYEGERGASCSDFLGDILPWQRRGGDWRDASGMLHGTNAYSVARVGRDATIWDVSRPVKQWGTAGLTKASFFLRPVGGSGYAKFHSREAKSVADRPMLVLEFAGDRREILAPRADTHLDCSTYIALGRNETLAVSSQHSTLLEFTLPDSVRSPDLNRVRLVLSGAGSGGNLEIGVFETAVPAFPSGPLRQGLAAAYPVDRGIERHSDVIFATGFDEPGGQWKSRWAKDGMGEIDVVAEDRHLRFAPLSGSALRVNLKKGSNLGFQLLLYLKDHGGEPDELYFRYYLRFADDWNPNLTSGKMPGLAATYNQSGWGGRRADGSSGWSMRGAFLKGFPSDHPMHDLTQLATYAYHADMKGDYGDLWSWPGVVLARNRWYCIEQYVRLNRPGAADGIVRVWLDGRLTMDRTDVRMRNNDRLRIETVWLNAYHGGAATSPHDQHFFIDNVVVARRYIGPFQRDKSFDGPAAK